MATPDFNEADCRKELEYYDQKNYWYSCFKPTKNGTKQNGLVREGFGSADEVISWARQDNDKGLPCVAINERPEGKTREADVTRVKNFIIDCDVASEYRELFASTDEHHDEALRVGEDVKAFLEQQGYTIGLMKDSGNGAHIAILVNIDVSTPDLQKQFKERAKILTKSLKALETAHVEIDNISSDLNRRLKLAGTANRKDTKQEVVRLCKITYVAEKTDAERNTVIFNAIPLDKKEKKSTTPTKNTNRTDDNTEFLLRQAVAAPQGTRSEAEFAVVCQLVKQGHAFESVDKIMLEAGATKWTEQVPYRRHTFDKATKLLDEQLNSADGLFAYCWGIWSNENFENKKHTVINQSVRHLTRNYHFKTPREENVLFFYEDGIYRAIGESFIKNYLERTCRLNEILDSKMISEIIQHVKNLCMIPELKEDPNFIGVKNGILDIRTKKVSPFNPEIILLNKINAAYDPVAKCDGFDKFLEGLELSADDQNAILELFGYCLLKDYPYHVAFMLTGGGRNGKSTLISILNWFLGESNCANQSLHALCKDRFAVAQLRFKLLCSFADIPKTGIPDSGIFKTIVGNDRISGQHKFGHPFYFKNYAKLVFSANELPRIEDDTDAFFRRWRIIPFEKKFDAGKNANENIAREVCTDAEASGILNLAIEGLSRLEAAKGRFSGTQTIDAIRHDYRMRADPIMAFSELYLIPDESSTLAKEDVYGVYQKICRARHWIVRESNVFWKCLRTLCTLTETHEGGRKTRARAVKGVRFDDEELRKFEVFVDGKTPPCTGCTGIPLPNVQHLDQYLETKKEHIIVENNELKDIKQVKPSLCTLCTEKPPFFPPDDVLQPKNRSLDGAQPPAASAVLAALKRLSEDQISRGCYFEALREALGVTDDALTNTLAEMLVRGDVQQLPGGRYTWI